MASFAARAACILLSAAALAACEPKPPPAPPPSPVVIEETKENAWLEVASDADRGKLDRAGTAWAIGLEEARKGGFVKAVEEEGKLLQRYAALQRPAPTPGSYRCRLVSLGRARGKGPAFEKFKPFFCYIGIEGELFTIVKQTGTQRPAGRLWEDDVATRLIFLGTLAIGTEEEARAYGEDPKRDVAGLFERIGPFRWRLVIPEPQGGARIEVFELTPVEEQPGE